MNFHRFLFNGLIARGQQVHVRFNKQHADVLCPPIEGNMLAFGAGAHCGGLSASNDAINATLSFNGGKDTADVFIPWAAIISVKTPFDDEWQVVARPVSVSIHQ